METGVMTVRRGRSTTFGGVEAAAEADLEQGEVGRSLAHGEEGGGGGDLEEGDRLRPVRGLAALEFGDQAVLGDEFAGEADALVEAGEVGRGVDVNAGARRLEAGAEHGHHRALAVGAGDVDHRRSYPSMPGSRSCW